ncbi:MAG: hypothetical protein KBC83_01360 [Candidatus Moranbacteria bacterium]|jgi:hypothetical protein|nr:hypothetical protein [Candidatus Moranbacteria bacterium]MBP9801297.1 hypothetical protein [Candidatus Moranbacteria bacterium]
MRSIHSSFTLFFLVFSFGFLVLTSDVQAEVFSPDECKAVLGTCKRSIFWSNCSGEETEVAKCNVNAESCCKIIKDAGGTVLSGASALTQFQRDLDGGYYTAALETAPVKSGAGMVASGPPPSSTSGTGAGNFNYTLLEKIPGQESATGSLPGYLQAILNATMMIIVLSAVFMISVGGFLYLTSAGNTSRAGQAKNIITDAIFGLILALVAYLVLYIINPDLITLRLDSLSTTSAPSGTSPTGAPIPTSEDVYAHADAVAVLSAKGINVTSSGSCSDPKRKECTSLDGIPKSTIANVIALKEKSGCSFNITGGTETGHATHGAGRSIVDVSEAPCLENVFRNQKPSLGSQYNIQSICADSTSREAAYGCSYVEPQPHFHIQFTT